MEFKRVFNKNVCVALGIIIILNILLFIKQQIDINNQFYEANSIDFYKYNELCNDFYCKNDSVDIDELENRLKDWYHNIISQNQEYRIIAKEAYKFIYNQINYIKEYENVLTAKIVQAEEMVQVSLYNDYDSFGYHNLLKTRYDLKGLYNLNLKLGSVVAIKRFFEYGLTKYFLLAIIVIILLSIRIKGTHIEELVRTTIGGRKKLCIKQYKIILIISLLVTMALYLPILLASFIMYGGTASLFQLIQANELYQFSVMTISNGMYILLFIMLQSIGAFTIGSLVGLIIFRISNTNVGICSLLCFGAIEFVFYSMNINNILLQLLRWFNIFAFVDWNVIMGQYLNIGVGTFIISRITLVLLAIVIIIVISIIINIISSEKVIEENNKEYFVKTIFMQNNWIILLIFSLYVLLMNIGNGMIYDEEYELLVNDYYRSVAGDAYETTDIYMDSIRDKIALIKESDENFSSNASLYADYEKALEKIEKQVENVRELNQAGIEAAIVNEYVVENRYRRMNNCYKNLSFIVIITILCLFYRYFSMEKANNMLLLIASSKNAKKYMRNKFCFISIVTMAIVLFGKIIIDIKIQNLFPMNDYELNSAIQSIPRFAACVYNISFETLDNIRNIMHIIGYLAFAYLIMSIALFENKYQIIILVIILVPYVLWYVGFSIFEKYSMVFYIIIIELIQTPNNFKMIIISGCVMILVTFIIIRIMNRRWRYV